MTDYPYLVSAFSVNQLAQFPATVQFLTISEEEVRSLLHNGFRSAVGHADTAALFEKLLQMPIEAHRVSISLPPGSWAVLGQYRGPRLAEGSTTLPENAHIQWYKIIVTK